MGEGKKARGERRIRRKGKRRSKGLGSGGRKSGLRYRNGDERQKRWKRSGRLNKARNERERDERENTGMMGNDRSIN